MKRLSVILLCSALAFPALAQMGGKAVNIESQQKKIAKSDATLENSKKVGDPKTWLSRGDLLQELFDENTAGLWLGMSKAEVRIIAGDSKNKKMEQIGSVEYEVHVYPTKDLYFENDKLALWQQIEVADADLLFKAQAAYEKAIELDAAGKVTKKVKEGLLKLSDKMRVEGLCSYSAQKYKAAQKYFMAAAACKLNPIVGVVDSAVIYYTGVVSCSEDVKDYENALKHFNLCLQHQYYDNGNVYTQLAAVFVAQKDTVQQEQMLKEGFTKFPTNQEILVALINFYLSSGDDPAKIITLLKQAQENDPTNASLYFVEGTLYEKLKDFDNAVLLYQKSIEIDPKYYNGYYNLGALHYNKAIEFITESTTIKDWKSPKIKELQNKADGEYKLIVVNLQ